MFVLHIQILHSVLNLKTGGYQGEHLLDFKVAVSEEDLMDSAILYMALLDFPPGDCPEA